MSSHLQGLNSSASHLADQRLQTAETLYKQGLLELRKFQAELHPQFFKKAFECFSRSLQRSRNQPNNYNALSYLWILLEDYTRALKFLKLQEISCKNSSEHMPLTLFLQKVSPGLFPELVQKVSLEDSPKPADIIMAQAILSPPVPNKFQTADLTLDFEALYERVEKKIYSHLKNITQLNLPPFTFDSQELKKIKVYQDRYQEHADEINERIGFLEQELEVSGLRQNLKKLEIYLQRINTCISTSKKFRRTRRGMVNLNKEVSEWIKQLQKNPGAQPKAEKELESFLDQCDGFADAVDSLDEQGFNVSVLEGTYSKLVAGLETFQDRLDDICAP